jgi:hypothetical protein
MKKAGVCRLWFFITNCVDHFNIRVYAISKQNNSLCVDANSRFFAHSKVRPYTESIDARGIIVADPFYSSPTLDLRPLQPQ